MGKNLLNSCGNSEIFLLLVFFGLPQAFKGSLNKPWSMSEKILFYMQKSLSQLIDRQLELFNRISNIVKDNLKKLGVKITQIVNF